MKIGRSSRDTGVIVRSRGAVRSGWLMMMALVAITAAGCQFGGYVPKGTHKPVAEQERNITDLRVGGQVSGRLDCAEESLCRVRYRVLVDRAGELSIQVDGPRGEGRDEGPRLARVILQDVDGRTLSRENQDEGKGPMQLSSAVQPGLHFVLVQGLGQAFDYQVSASFDSAKRGSTLVESSAPTGAAAAAEAASPAQSPRALASLSGTGRAVPGDTDDGADFAYDPTVNLVLIQTYAFAQDPVSQLEGEEAQDRGDPFLIRRVQREIRYALGDYGIAQVEPEKANYLISVQVGSRASTWYTVNNVIYNQPYQSYFNNWSAMGAFVRPHSYLDGTLVIDFIDPKSEKLVWHGWTTEPVNTKLDQDDLLGKAVRAVLAQVGKG